jgi:antitoxin (DNA-binding transcriptional repressor) of toxin-antitoxin stability system
MTQITLSEAQQNLSAIIAGLQPGEEVQILQDDCPVARLMVEPKQVLQPRVPGSAIGTITIIAEDDEHLQAFADYMP